MKYPLHPLAKLFSLIEDDQFREFVEDIRKNGLLHAIILYRGKLLDGKRRLRACEILGIKPRFVEWDGNGSLLAWLMSVQYHRRHLSPSQRAVIASKALSLLAKEAKQRQRLSQGRSKKGRKTLPTSSTNGRAVDHAAKLFHSNANYIQKVQVIAEKAPELVSSIESGQFTVPEARRLADEAKKIRQEVLARAKDNRGSDCRLRRLIKESQDDAYKKAAREGKQECSGNIITGDFRLLWKRLKDESCDMIFSDPPWDKASIPLYGELAALAAAKLKPRRLCLVYAGTLYLDQVILQMREHLLFWHLFAVPIPGGNRVPPVQNVESGCRYIIAFYKPPMPQARYACSDLLPPRKKEKQFYKYQQGQAEAEYVLHHLTAPGDFIVDPFCGSGTVLVACKKDDRRWLGTEILPDVAAIARKRLAETALLATCPDVISHKRSA